MTVRSSSGETGRRREAKSAEERDGNERGERKEEIADRENGGAAKTDEKYELRCA